MNDNEKYTDLIKDVAKIISEGERERFLLSYELESTKAKLEAAEAKIEELVALHAVTMMREEDRRA